MFMDKRSGKIALVAHCLLNQNSRAIGLAKSLSVINEIVEFLVRKEIGIIQMPCPELAYVGVSRQPQTREQYNNANFRRCCRKMVEEIVNLVQEYAKAGVKLKIVVGIEGSPSCGVNEILGIFMEELRSKLDEEGLSAPFYGISLERLKEDIIELEKLVK
ncbi:MAG: 2-thiouracil desulfurase family protein [Candidatus Bathyarchaeota archaeon]|jgi:predicted secreted protein|nr:2-thiouracil desulfurase family protein [Candidatus Bathyarchaeota archaeon]